ncbi:exonuclease domain-containing protein [Bergeyella zoohelcum]|uniref:BRCT domain-containing protein n=1 Tax=Bergeyella zoohelcum ATCC 43767 TaxID=883096 RepID=K1M2K2_9FLAO|nr:exonuclease domain-containing protein [Bergeyella zoohelcum]EKB56598.1 hypothetical protein HMPREF9699_01327 [Bergeyella zoohelcum ATCC 43767]SUV48494.1 DNA ligase [Bergeyella zoohelcum]
MDFVAIDFETANELRSSTCAVGVCVVENSKIVEEREWLIQPFENRYSKININIHGITPEMTADKPTFIEVWDEIKPYIDNRTIIAHNGENFERTVLEQTLKLYNLSIYDLSFKMVDTLTLSKNLFKHLKDYTLQDICQLVAVPFENSKYHNALYDAKKTAELGLLLYEHFTLDSNFNFTLDYVPKSRARKGSLLGSNKEEIAKNKEARKISSELKQMKTDVEDTSHPLYQKRVVITGVFQSFPVREEMAKLLYNIGADINTSISSRTDFVVIGEKAGPKKLEQIEKLGIATIDEQEFLKLFNL